MTRTSWVRISGAIAAGVMALLICALMQADAASAAGKGPVLNPRAGGRLPARPFVVRIKTGRNPRVFRTQLNGDPIGQYFSDPSSRGVRKLRVSRSYGLRHGLNHLHVRLHRRHADARSLRVRFWIRHDRPLAGAGIDRDAAVGDRVSVGAGSSSHLAKAAGAGSSNLDKSWEVLDAPPGSPADAGLSGADRARPTIHPRVPGTYRLRLTVKAQDGKTGSDMVLVDARPGPLPRIDTMTEMSGGPPGIRVGDQVYEAGSVPTGQVPWMQVLVLNRSTLEKVSNQTYGCAPAPAFCSNGDLGSYLRGLPNTDLVIAANHQGGSWRAAGAPSPFTAIGSETYTPSHVSNVAGGFSIIGVPHLPQGQADSKFAISGPAGGGQMTGYLTQDQWANYTWLPKDRPAFDTRAPGTVCSTACDVSVSIGDKTYRPCGQTQPGDAEYGVVVLNPITLQQEPDPGDPRCYLVNAGPFDTTKFLNRMRTDLNSIPDGDLVIIVSLTTSSAKQTLPPAGGNTNLINAIDDTARAVACVGGTRDLFLRSGTTPGAEYSLVGWKHSPPECEVKGVGNAIASEGSGQETSKVSDPGSDGRLQGVLTPDHQQRFRPTDAIASGAPPQILTRLLVQPPSKWPLDGDEGAQAAIRWIGSTPKLQQKIGPNVRSAYWIQGFDEADWTKFENNVKELAYPGSQTGFSRADFLSAQAELAQEMDWVGTVRSYMSFLSQPFSADTAISSWADLRAKVVDPITSKLKPKKTGAMRAVEIFQQVLKVVPGAGAKVVTVALNFGLNYLNQGSDGSDIDEIRAEGDKLGAAMIDRIQSARKSFQQMGDIIVADYDKLRTVAQNERCNPTSPTCLPEWQFTSTDQQRIATGVWRGTQSSLTQELVKLAFPAYLLTNGPNSPGLNSHTDPRNHDDYWCTDLIGIRTYPFDHLPDRGFASMEMDVSPRYHTFVLANLDDVHATNPDPSFPPASILQRMFDPVSPSLDPEQGGLGIYEPDYVREANAGVPTFTTAYRNQVGRAIIDYCEWEKFP
jgi:hypothetical protein